MVTGHKISEQVVRMTSAPFSQVDLGQGIWNEMEDGEEPLNLNETLDAQVTCSLLLKAKMEWLLKV